MNAKHTPGPWEVSEDDYGDELWFGGDGKGLVSVNGFSNGGCKDRPEEWQQLLADARLMAAAPELLDVAEMFQRQAKAVLQSDGLGFDLERYKTALEFIMPQIDAAIAKAKGA